MENLATKNPGESARSALARTIAARLRLVRQVLGKEQGLEKITQDRLADLIGLSVSNIKNYETAAAVPDALFLLKLYQGTGFTPTWVISRAEPMRVNLFDSLEPILSKETDHAPESDPESDDRPSAAAPTGAAKTILADCNRAPSGRECLASSRGGCSVPGPATIRIVIEIPGGEAWNI